MISEESIKWGARIRRIKSSKVSGDGQGRPETFSRTLFRLDEDDALKFKVGSFKDRRVVLKRFGGRLLRFDRVGAPKCRIRSFKGRRVQSNVFAERSSGTTKTMLRKFRIRRFGDGQGALKLSVRDAARIRQRRRSEMLSQL